MKKSLKRSIFTLAISLLLCLSFIINASATVVLMTQTTFTAYCGHTVYCRAYEDNANIYWCAVETYCPTAIYQKYYCKLFLKDQPETNPRYITDKLIIDQYGGFHICNLSYLNDKAVMYEYGYHEVSAYDMGYWIMYEGYSIDEE